MTQCFSLSKNNLFETIYNWILLNISFIQVFSVLLYVYGLYSPEFLAVFLLFTAGISGYFLFSTVSWQPKEFLADMVSFLFFFFITVACIIKNPDFFYWSGRIDDWAHYGYCKSIFSGEMISYTPGMHLLVCLLTYIIGISLFQACNLYIIAILFLFSAGIYCCIKHSKNPLFSGTAYIVFLFLPFVQERFYLFLPENTAIAYFPAISLGVFSFSPVAILIIIFCSAAAIMSSLSYFTLFLSLSLAIAIFSATRKNFFILLAITAITAPSAFYFYVKSSSFFSASPDRLQFSVFFLILILPLFYAFKKTLRSKKLVFFSTLMALSVFYLLAAGIPPLVRILQYGPRLTYAHRYLLYFSVSALLFLMFSISETQKKIPFFPSVFLIIFILNIFLFPYSVMRKILSVKEPLYPSTIQTLRHMKRTTVISNWPSVNMLSALTHHTIIDGLAGQAAQISTQTLNISYRLHFLDYRTVTSQSLYYLLKNYKNPVIYVSPDFSYAYQTYRRLKNMVSVNDSKECQKFYSAQDISSDIQYKTLITILSDTRYFTCLHADPFSQTALFTLK